MDVAHLDGPLFDGLSEGQRQLIAQHADEVSVTAGKELMHADGLAWEFFVIRSGEVAVRQGAETIRTLGPGDFFGEIGVMEGSGARRTASVVTTSPTTAIVMSSQDLRMLAGDMPQIGDRLQSTIAERKAEHP